MQQSRLKECLNHPGYPSLKQVLEAKALRHEMECFNAMAKTPIFEKYEVAAISAKKKAEPYRLALDALAEIEKETVHSTTTKIIHEI